MLPVSQSIAHRAESLSLGPRELTRYSRHILLPEVGTQGQRRLKAARVLVIGAGGLGSPVSLYLAASGIGTLGLVDFDAVDVTNLQRQILYGEADAGRSKLTAARERLKALNSDVDIVCHTERLAAENVETIFADYDVIVDGTDNFPTRYLANDACVRLGKPYVYGSIFRFDGQASVFYPPHGPCYRCLFPTPPVAGQVPNCAEGGVLGVLPGQIGTIQANEAIKLVLGIGTPLLGRLLTLDALDMRVETYRLPADPRCPACGTPASQAASRVEPAHGEESPPLIDVAAYRQIVADKGRHFLLDVRSPGEAEICSISGSHLIPIAELDRRTGELPSDGSIIVYCKTGGRSARATLMLRRRGFADVRSLAGGILAWIDAYDREMPKY